MFLWDKSRISVDVLRSVFVLLIFSVSTTATGDLCRHAAAFPLSYDNTIARARRVNEYPGEKMKKVWELFLHYADRIVKMIGYMEG